MNFCKVFSVSPDDQVLAMIGYDLEEGHHYLSLTTDLKSLRVTVTFSTGSEEAIQQNFADFDFARALEWRHKMEQMETEYDQEETDEQFN